ncbi:DUF1049 domain-containing protein [Corynebacterium sp. 3HC-13]|uniref:LapA family protein n=1 Tax=Corynebacterium poyangense TaxID=2684405 RepID=UPI001CC97D0C|nr:lipopolysaccharide assembly protein LapA domain-containing protein [Corynebacterium poyangense]MBZ8178042.1 DUF1049 domain-containing protein [Corynebacterium poyangense]
MTQSSPSHSPQSDPHTRTDTSDSSASSPTPSTDDAVVTPPPSPRRVQGSLAGSTWVGLIIGALLLILLIVFIVQNQQPATVTLLAWDFTLSAGLIYLLFAIFGALIMALVGGVRMIQLRRQVRQ